jgi:hypothetical protein
VAIAHCLQCDLSALLQVAQDGKLPKITSLLHVEVFHTLCQHPDLTKKVSAGSCCL